MKTVTSRFVALALLLSGCAAQVPTAGTASTPEQARAQQCDWATMLASSGKLAAALALPPDAEPVVRDSVAAAARGVDAALEQYCGAVGTTAEHAALVGLRQALDDLTARTLARP